MNTSLRPSATTLLVVGIAAALALFLTSDLEPTQRAATLGGLIAVLATVWSPTRYRRCRGDG